MQWMQLVENSSNKVCVHEGTCVCGMRGGEWRGGGGVGGREERGVERVEGRGGRTEGRKERRTDERKEARKEGGREGAKQSSYQ